MSTISWAGSGGTVATPKSGSFGSAANWSGDRVPSVGDDVAFAAGDYTVRIPTSVSLNSFEIGQGVTWRFESMEPNTLDLASGGVNLGTIVSTYGYSVQTSGTIENDGRIIGNPYLPSYASGTVSNHGTIADGSRRDGYGGISFFNLTNAVNGRIVTPVAGTIFVTGALTNQGLVRVQDHASLQQAAAGVTGSTTNLVDGVLTGGRWEAYTQGFIDLHGSAGVTELAAGTVIILSGDRSEFMVATGGFASEVGLDQSLGKIDAGATLEAVDGRGFGIPATGALVIDGAMRLGGGTLLSTTLDGAGTLTGFGTVASDIASADGAVSGLALRASGGTLSVTGDNRLGGLLTGSGTLAFTSGTDRIEAGAALMAKTVTLAGATLTLDEDLATTSAMTLQSGTLDLNGHGLTLRDVTFAGGAIADNAGSGALRLVGTREVTHSTTIGADVVNSGTSEVSASLSVTGRVTGTGVFAVSSGIALHFGDEVGAGQTIDLSAASGASLIIEKASLFKATVAGFSGSDAIDLATLDDGGSLSLKDGRTPGVIEVLSGTHAVAAITIAGHNATQMSLGSDGHGGTTLVQIAA